MARCAETNLDDLATLFTAERKVRKAGKRLSTVLEIEAEEWNVIDKNRSAPESFRKAQSRGISKAIQKSRKSNRFTPFVRSGCQPDLLLG